MEAGPGPGRSWRAVEFKLAHLSASSRPRTEDRLAIHHLAGGLVVVVADGAGGLSGGGAAAQRALAIVERALGRPGVEPFASATWTQALAEADREIEEDAASGETTAVVVAVPPVDPVEQASRTPGRGSSPERWPDHHITSHYRALASSIVVAT